TGTFTLSSPTSITVQAANNLAGGSYVWTTPLIQNGGSIAPTTFQASNAAGITIQGVGTLSGASGITVSSTGGPVSITQNTITGPLSGTSATTYSAIAGVSSLQANNITAN